MMREGGLPVTDLFNRVRLRVNDITKGAQVSWNASKLQAPFYFFERAPDAPPPSVSVEQTSTIRSKPIRDFDAGDIGIAFGIPSKVYEVRPNLDAFSIRFSEFLLSRRLAQDAAAVEYD
jgi:hypothetical protein